MQDIHSIGGGGSRLLGGGGGGGGAGIDRRLRPNHQNNQALKCPRCDSLNTKFCYYNNYNLSQPRHFCKNCRRYWTKGGVLRNVPVGGGCRKTKRSKPKPSSDCPRERKSNSHSSSESSSLTATTNNTTATATTTTTEAVSEKCTSSAPTMFTFPDSSRFFIPQTANTNFDPSLLDNASDGGIFPEIGGFTGLMTAANDPTVLGFNFSDISPYRMGQESHEPLERQNDEQWQIQETTNEMKVQEVTTGFLDQNRTDNNGEEFTTVDWQAGGDQGMFDLPGTVDQAYWNSQSQWSETDHSLFLP